MTPTPTICAGCGAIRQGIRWNRAGSPRARRLAQAAGMNVDICTMCHTRRPGLPHGYLHVDGEFVRTHRQEVEQVIEREASAVHQQLPAAALLACEDDGSGGLLVTTSLGHLAARLGHVLEEKYDGQVHYGVVAGSGMSHVWWHR